MKFTNEDFLKIHNALFSYDNKVEVQDKQLEIIRGNNFCKCIKTEQWTFMEQNKATKSSFAKRANNGDKITWAIPTMKNPSTIWGLIINNELKTGIE